MEFTLISLVIAVTVFTTAVVSAAIISRLRYHRAQFWTPLRTLLVGTAISGFVMFLPIMWMVSNGAPAFWRGIETILLSLGQVIRMFINDCDYSAVQALAAEVPKALGVSYTVFASLILIFAPALTFSTILSFFRNITSYIRLTWHRYDDLYIFSELNEKSLSLAKSILQKGRRSVVFTDVFHNDSEEEYELMESAKELGAILFKKDILSLKLNLHSRSKNISFFTIGEDEADNITHSFGLLEAYKHRENTMLYVFSTSIDGELIMTAAEKGAIKVRRIKDVRSLVYRTLYDMENAVIDAKATGDVLPPDLFSTAKPSEDGEKHIGAVVVGCGLHGTEMIKALSWFCQMDGYKVSIDAFDIDPLAESKFSALCPELMSEKYNGVYVPGEAQYMIHIHSGLDVDSLEFAKKIKELTDTTYVFVSMATDERNIRTAVDLRTLFTQMHIHPIIHSVVYSPEKKKALCNIKNFRGQPYDVTMIGDLDTLYSEEVIIDSELEEDALARHMKYSDDEGAFWGYEYNYRSSMASALHMRARIAVGTPGAGKPEDALTPEERAHIELLEHRRWNAYMRSEGYIFSGSTDRSSRNDLGKMHHDLVDFDSLSEEEKRKDSRVGSN